MEDTQFDVSPEEMQNVARKMLKASDNYAKMDTLEDVVDWGQRLPFVWHMIAQGVYPAWQDPAIWSELAEEPDVVTAAQIADFLTKIETFEAAADESTGGESASDEDDGYDDYGGYGGDEYGGYGYDGGGSEQAYRPSMFLSYWPQPLDDLVFAAYAKAPAVFDARSADYSEEIRRGLEFVAFRLGKTDTPPAGVLNELALAQAGDEGLPWAVNTVDAAGEFTEFELGNEENLRVFVERFGTWEAWGQALLDAAFAQEYLPSFERLHGAWTVATTQQLHDLLADVSAYGNNAARIVDYLLQRPETAAQLVELGQRLADDGGEQVAEIPATAALLRVSRDGAAVPDGIEKLIGFDMYGSPMQRSGFEAVDVFDEALNALPPERLEARILELFAGEYTKSKPFGALRLARQRGLDVLDAAFAAMRSKKEEYQTFHGLRSEAVGLSWLPSSDVDALVAEFEKPGTPAMKDAFRRAVTGVLADTKAFDEPYDRFLTCVDWHSDVDANDLGYYVLPDVLAAVGSLSEERAAAILLRDARAEQNWGRVFGALAERPIASVLDVAFERLGRDGIGAERAFFRDLLRKQAELVAPRLGGVLAAQADADFHNAVKSELGEERYNVVLAASGAESAADKGKADKIRRLADAYLQAHPDAPRARVAIFERSDEPPDERTIARIGGRPFGLSADTWPKMGDDDDSPMEHLVTIDVAKAPSLQHLNGVRAVALFCHSPGHNEAYGAGNATTSVMLLSEEDVSRGPYQGALPTGSDDAVGMTSHAIEVPSELFSVEYGTNPELEAVRGALYQANAWSGPEPIWLQGDDHWGNFLFQFDEGFVYMNLGDMGVMYVFDDTAFWQCH